MRGSASVYDGSVQRWDAIVVGARCAGSPTALLLARAGHRVLLVDRVRFPSDTLSTHFMQVRGSSYLARWGLLGRVLAETPSWHAFTLTREGVSITGAPPVDALRARLAALHGTSDGATLTWCAPRRTFLDALLVDAAAAAGVEVREGVVVDELLQENGAVVGIRGRATGGGAAVEERARLVIAADGRHSRIARSLGAPAYHARSRCTFAYWSYWSGLSLESLPWPMHLRGRYGVAAFPTNDGLIHVLVMGPDEWFREFRRDVEGNYRKVVALVVPELAERLDDAVREERIYGTADQPNCFRVPYGRGWALVGDAGYAKDQCTAIGMTHAFRDAELLASAVDAWLRGERDYDAALGEYQRVRDEDSRAYYDLVTSVAEMNEAAPEEIDELRALQGDQERIDRFLGVFQDVIPLERTS